MSGSDDTLERVLGLGRPLLLGLDVDGTLSAIVRDPDMAVIPPETIEVLARLSRTPGLELALVTGRDLGSLSRMEQLEGIWRAAEHGGVVLAPREEPKQRTLKKAQEQALARFRQWVDENAEGAFIEHKPQAIAVHVRAIALEDPARAERLMAEADALATRLGLHVRRGKALREAEAVRHDKGAALREIFERSRVRSLVFIGDDLTDFPAIELAAQHGIGMFVRSEEQRATPPANAVVLDGVDEVAELLRRLADRLEG